MCNYSTGRMNCIEQSILVENKQSFSIIKLFPGFLNRNIEDYERKVCNPFCKKKKKKWSSNYIFFKYNIVFGSLFFSDMVLAMTNNHTCKLTG